MGSKLELLASDYYNESGIVYIMKFNMGEEIGYIYKIGITERDPVDRFMEVIRSYYQIYRHIPRCGIKRFRKVAKYREVEKELHSIYKDKQYQFEKKFDGSTEFFKLDEDELLERYELMCPKSI